MNMKVWKPLGGGISSTTLNPTPFHSYTKTPDAKHVRMAPKDPNAALPTIDENKVASPPKHRANGAPPPVTTAQWNIGVKLRESSFVAQLDAGHVDNPGQSYRGLLDKPCYFDFGTAVAAKAQLAEQLAQVHARLGDNPALPREMKGAEMMVVTQAVSLACKGHDPSLAARSLACLGNLNLHASITNPDAPRPEGFNEDEFACAWRIAQALEKTPTGFACLKKIAVPAHGEQAVHESVTSEDDKMLHVYMTAVREKAREDRLLPVYPQGVFSEIPDNPRTLLDKSLRAVQAHLVQSGEHARNNPGAAFTPAKHAHEWAIGAVNNGFYTDKRKDANGKSTPFYKAENRLKKMSKWVSRANGTNNADPTGSNHEALGKDASKIRKIGRLMRNVVLPGKKKSPLNAVNRQAPETVLPYVGAAPGSGFRNAEAGGLGEARAIRSMVDILEKGLEANRGGLANQPANPDAETLENMVRLAILQQVKADTKFLWLNVNIGLDDNARSMVKERVYAALDGGVAGQSQATKDEINKLVDNQHTNLTAETMAAWATKAGCPASVPDAGQVAEGQPDWHAFRLAQRRATEPVRPTEMPNLKTISKADTARMIADHTKNHELGSRVVMYSGGVGGFGTKQLSGLFTKLISKKVLRLQADVRAEGTRCATLEIGTGSQGNELFLGTQRILKGQVGAGASVGVKVASWDKDQNSLSASVGGDAAIGLEGQDKNGVMIRFDRLKGGVGGDQANNAKLARVATKLMAPDALPEGAPYANAHGDDAASPLKNLWQEWPEVSISLVETKEKAGLASASVSGGLGAAFGKFKLGVANAGLSIAGKFKGKTAWTETGGSLHVDKKSTYWSVKASASASVASLGGALGTVEVSDTDMDLNVTGGEPLGGTVGFWKNGYTQTDTFVEHQGELKKTSVRIKSYQNAQSFVDNVAPKLDEWAEEKTKRFNPGGYGADAPENETPIQEQQRIQKRNAAIETEHTKLRQYLQRSLDNAEPTQTFWEFKEIKSEAVAAANAVKSVAVMAQECGDKPAAQECTKYRSKLLKSEEAWEPTFLVDYETTAQQRTLTPVNFFLKSSQLDGINVSNIRTFA